MSHQRLELAPQWTARPRTTGSLETDAVHHELPLDQLAAPASSTSAIVP